MDGFGLTGVWCSVRLVAWRSAAVLAGCRCKGGGAGGVREGGFGAGGDLKRGWDGVELGEGESV